MAAKKLKPTTKKPSVLSGLKSSRRLLLCILVGLFIVIILVVWIVVAAHFRHEAAIKQQQQQADVNVQQQRFDGIRQLQQKFETNVKESLGASLTGINEYDRCYNTEQHSDFDHGRLFCSIEIQGTTNELPNVANSGHGAWDTGLVIAGAAKSALQQSGLAFSPSVSENRPGLNDHVNYLDIYTLYGKAVRCDLSVVNQYVGIKAGQLKFTFDCSQPASKMFFQYNNFS